jgi:hypothetical protein
LFFFSIFQISTLIQHRSERPHTTSATSERTLRAIGRVGQAVNLVNIFSQQKIISNWIFTYFSFHFTSQAVERFVTVGETIADDNPDIKQDMYDACKEARAAGEIKNIYGNENWEMFEENVKW